MKNPNVSWDNLPKEEDLAMMTCEEVSNIRDILFAEEITIPDHVLDWVVSNAPNCDKEQAYELVKNMLAKQRGPYLKDLLVLSEQKLKDDPLHLENKILAQEVQERTSFVWMLQGLGLRGEEEKSFIVNKFQPNLAKNNDSLIIQDSTLKTQLELPGRQRYLHKQLTRWKQALDEIDQGLPVVKPELIKIRLREEIAKPFHPSQKEIQSTRYQMGGYDYDVGDQGAINLLKREDQERKELYQNFLDKLEDAPAPSRIKP